MYSVTLGICPVFVFVSVFTPRASGRQHAWLYLATSATRQLRKREPKSDKYLCIVFSGEFLLPLVFLFPAPSLDPPQTYTQNFHAL